MQTQARPSAAIALPTRRGLSRVEAAGYIGISPNTFDRMIKEGTMPAPVEIYSRKVWDVRAIDLAMNALSGLADSPNATNPWDCSRG